jgi:hypothetical protein
MEEVCSPNHQWISIELHVCHIPEDGTLSIYLFTLSALLFCFGITNIRCGRENFWLTPWSWVFLEKPQVNQLLKNFRIFVNTHVLTNPVDLSIILLIFIFNNLKFCVWTMITAGECGTRQLINYNKSNLKWIPKYHIL